VTSSKCDST